MTKIKPKSAAQKRFKVSSKGIVIASQSGKQHFMRNKSKKSLRNQRGTTALCIGNSKIIKKKYLKV